MAAQTASFDSSLLHLLTEMERVDSLIRAHADRVRDSIASESSLPGLYISEAEFESLLFPPRDDRSGSVRDAGAGRRQREERSGSREAGAGLRLEQLCDAFQLSPMETDALLIGFAPELSVRYERLYAYLQNDITRKRPTVDLIAMLLGGSAAERIEIRDLFAPHGALVRKRLVQTVMDPAYPQAPLLSQYVKVDCRIVDYLFGSDAMDRRLEPFASLAACQSGYERSGLPEGLLERLSVLAADTEYIFYLQCAAGCDRQALAAAASHRGNRPVLVLHGAMLADSDAASVESALSHFTREARLRNACVLFSAADTFLGRNKPQHAACLWRRLREWIGPVFLAGEKAWEPPAEMRDRPFARIELPIPSYAQRLALWRACAGESSADLAIVASQFRLTAGTIEDAWSTACNMARWRDPGNPSVSTEDLFAACRLRSGRGLAELARSITPRYGWDDLVLPPERLIELREICDAVRYRGLVYEEWGFDRKIQRGRGINVLFAGTSGTGKTMAAEVIARELGLDLYQIDLSGIVSKYIGETEKNLARIFQEAGSTNAILFFDEADALFGKRSEVRDAHDRYANIEVNYLLQKMEEHEGMVILATNLRKNMDEAFVRRLHATVEFPFPDAGLRSRIWRNIWPAAGLCADDIDLEFMARQFEVSGGNIRNIAVTSAFLAAGNGGRIKMEYLIRATRLEYQKMRKVVADSDFGKYASRTNA